MTTSFECPSKNNCISVFIYDPGDDDGYDRGCFCYNLKTFGNTAYSSDNFWKRADLVMDVKRVLQLLHVDVEELNIDFSSFWQSAVET